MIILCLVVVVILLILIRLILFFIVTKYGKFSYDGFSGLGFSYNAEKDIFYSTKNAWQKNFGYTHLYDIFAPIFRMIIDTEPIRFSYNNKNWLITFWKGQYGIVTGAEIGIYCTDEKNINKKTVYFPASDCEMLNMYLILYKNGKVITKISAKHWWLAIFKLGIFSNPEELSMDINIAFPNNEMLTSFLNSFKKLGYDSQDFKVIDNTFCFKYIKPRTRKVWTRTWLTDKIRQFFNRKNVELYNRYLYDLIDNNKIDDSRLESSENFVMINELLPDLLKNASESNEHRNQIRKRIFSTNEKNIVFINKSIYSRNRVNKA